jgi:fucose permease
MSKIRAASSFQSGATSAGFWAGMAAGRLGLSFVTARLGEFYSILAYIFMCLALELIFWLVPSLIVSAVAVALLGVFIGPLFPTGMVLLTKMMPKHLHVGAVGFAAAFGGGGGAIFPFIVGAIAQRKGVESLQPVILAILILIASLWMCLPNSGKKIQGEEAELRGGR